MQYMKPSAAQEITTGIFKTIIKQGLRHNIMLVTGIHQLKICEEELKQICNPKDSEELFQ